MSNSTSGGLTQLTPPYRLEGITLPNGWTIARRVEKIEGDSGGHFSVGYDCVSATGMRAFLKAIDIYKPIDDSRARGDVVNALTMWTAEVRGERELLNDCRRMNRVINVLDQGDLNELQGEQLTIPIPYIIFEWAEGSARRAIGSRHSTSGWRLRVLHHAAVGLRQMHGDDIAHQDLKLSNIMLLPREQGAKISDLGSAVRKGRSVPHDALEWPGDWGYVPPEFAYGYMHSEFNVRRISSDLYLLGNCLCTMLVGTSITSMLVDELPMDFRPRIYFGGAYSGSFEDVLPYLHDAHQKVLNRIRSAIDSDTAFVDDVVTLIAQLCNPDPNGRGHPRTRAINASGGNIYALERFVAQLNLLANKAAQHERTVKKQ